MFPAFSWRGNAFAGSCKSVPPLSALCRGPQRCRGPPLDFGLSQNSDFTEEHIMENNHSIPFDAPPKRRKHKDNPYTIRTSGIHTDHPRYFLEFQDGQGVTQFMELSKELYEKRLPRFSILRAFRRPWCISGGTGVPGTTGPASTRKTAGCRG